MSICILAKDLYQIFIDEIRVLSFSLPSSTALDPKIDRQIKSWVSRAFEVIKDSENASIIKSVVNLSNVNI